MRKKDGFRRGLYNFYLVNGPHMVSGKSTLSIVVYHGKKSDDMNFMPRPLDGKPSPFRYAILGQVYCETLEEYAARCREFIGDWLKEYDMTPVEAEQAKA